MDVADAADASIGAAGLQAPIILMQADEGWCSCRGGASSSLLVAGTVDPTGIDRTVASHGQSVHILKVVMISNTVPLCAVLMDC